MRAFVFLGQGSQKIGMGQDLADSFPAARAVFDEVDDEFRLTIFKIRKQKE